MFYAQSTGTYQGRETERQRQTGRQKEREAKGKLTV